MLKEFIITGGMVALAVLIFKLLLDQHEELHPGEEKNIKDLTDEQLIVDEVSPGEIKSWYMNKNPNRNYTNVLIRPTAENLEKFDIPDSLFNDAENYLVQVVFDDADDKLISCRVIIYNTLNSQIADLLDNSGVVIFD